MHRETLAIGLSRSAAKHWVPRGGADLLSAPRSVLYACLLVLATAGCSTFSGDAGKRADGTAKRGGYYLDDGPGEHVPAQLDQVADAIPRIEPLHRGASRPYTVMGRSYTPMTALRAYRARGVATWYGRRYHGNRTSSGEIYDMYAMTAAHTVLPIPSYARVTNVANGRSIVVRINDRGPFLGERLIDLSYVAAHKLDLVRNGSALVEVESILPDSYAAQALPPPQAATASALAAPAPLLATPPAAPAADAEPQPQPTSVASLQAADSSFYLQLGAFTVRDNAERFLERMRLQLAGAETSLLIVAAGSWHRVHAGPYASRDAALEAAGRIGAALGTAPVLIAPR
jgi:rare lipoprotein A